jgi:hypothetical protein
VIDERTPRMSTQDYFACLDRAARARGPAEVRQLRLEVMRRWRGDPRADDLVEALYAHLERLAEEPADRRPAMAGSSGLGARVGRSIPNPDPEATPEF